MVCSTRSSGENAGFEHALQHAPEVSMLPTPFSRDKFQEALRLAQPFNELVHLISQDSDFILNSLELTAKGDDFTGRLVDIFNTVRDEDASASNTSLGALDLITWSIREEICSDKSS